MRITVIGRGSVGGGLARLWAAAGHEVTGLGKDGGSAEGSDVVVVAVPGAAIAGALAGVSGIAGQPVIDATNVYGARDERFASNAEQIKSITGSPVAKSFNVNFASEYPRISEQEIPPGNLVAADEGARDAAERLNRDAGYEPVYVGDLRFARMMEDMAPLVIAVAGELGPYFYRFAPSR
ncbi:dinucleotide-binding protein [Pseudonocardia endophytica]|uniref:Pyrroline-5-carboxylate reductase catalytic N-terminal domain-containing protein n=1 Tax=Pseudonocardia endophytica TaxID=401976 RepID=A0A4R1HX48_PSEEN|nr:dinucleotide-binding protein [Pseudonocardia endophytica]TCK22112.1 hypothetical protein EV378_6111 [Pseudonocardia endophytica]